MACAICGLFHKGECLYEPEQSVTMSDLFNQSVTIEDFYPNGFVKSSGVEQYVQGLSAEMQRAFLPLLTKLSLGTDAKRELCDIAILSAWNTMTRPTQTTEADLQRAWSICFTVHGHPEPQGSTKAFIPKGWDRPVVTTDNKKLKPWRQTIAFEALLAMTNGLHKRTENAVSVICQFYFTRPKSVKAEDKVTKPDVDKLLRAVLDALTGVCFRDDAQVTHCEASKQFSEDGERAVISVIAAANGVRRR